jgi:hypothetical protein
LFQSLWPTLPTSREGRLPYMQEPLHPLNEPCVYSLPFLKNESWFFTWVRSALHCKFAYVLLIFKLVKLESKGTYIWQFDNVKVSVPNPDPHVFGPLGSGSGTISQRYGSGSGFGSFYHQANIERKTLIPTAL